MRSCAIKTLLLTTFEPFAGKIVNLSLEVTRHLASASIADAYFDVVELPVSRFEAIDMALHCIRRTAPDVVLMGKIGVEVHFLRPWPNHPLLATGGSGHL